MRKKCIELIVRVFVLWLDVVMFIKGCLLCLYELIMVGFNYLVKYFSILINVFFICLFLLMEMLFWIGLCFIGVFLINIISIVF